MQIDSEDLIQLIDKEIEQCAVADVAYETINKDSSSSFVDGLRQSKYFISKLEGITMNSQEEIVPASDEEDNEFEEFYRQRYGQYNLEDYQDLIDWADELDKSEPDPYASQNENDVPRMGICIRLLDLTASAERVRANVFQNLYFDLVDDSTLWKMITEYKRRRDEQA